MVQVLGNMAAAGLGPGNQLPLAGGQPFEAQTEEHRVSSIQMHLMEVERNKKWDRFYLQPWFTCLLAFIFWIVVGTTFYSLWHDWGVLLAFYYHMQAGFAIGFGFPTEDMICDNQEIRNDIVRGWTEAPFRWATPIEGGRGGCAASDISKLVTTILCLIGSSLIASSIGVIVQAASAPPGGWYLNLISQEKIKSLQAQADETETWTDDIVIYLKILMSKSWFRALWMIALWIAVGILYGVLSEQKMTFITSLYYAVTAVSTAGLEAPKLIQYGKEVGLHELEDWHWAFSGLYVLFGVPLYGWALSALASGYVDWVTATDMDNTLHEAISEDEYQLMDYLGEPNEIGSRGDGQIDMFEFVECQILRLNLVSVNHLFQIKKRFIELDIDDSGTVNKEELILPSELEHEQNPKMHYALEFLKDIHAEIEDMRLLREQMTMEEKIYQNEVTQYQARIKTAEARKNKTWGRCYKQAWFVCLMIFVVWAISAVVFYSNWQYWGFWESLFYAVQAGMSVGFPLPAEDDICLKYERGEEVSGLIKYWVGEGHMFKKAVEGGRGGCHAGDLSKLFTVFLILVGSSIIASGLGIIAAAFLNPPGGWYKTLIKEAHLAHLHKKAMETDAWVDDIFVYAQIVWDHNVFKAIVTFLFWAGMGIIYGCFSEQRMTFLTSMYFSITSIATAGLEGVALLGPMTETPQGALLTRSEDINEGNWVFMIFFLVIGIPLYGWALTAIGEVTMSSLTDKHIHETLHEQISHDEFELIDYLGDFNKGDGGDGAVDMFEFVECQLLRLNYVSVHQLFDIKRRFLELDLDGSGTINRDELVATGGEAMGEHSAEIQHALEAMDEIMEEIHEMKAAHIHPGSGGPHRPNRHGHHHHNHNYGHKVNGDLVLAKHAPGGPPGIGQHGPMMTPPTTVTYGQPQQVPPYGGGPPQGFPPPPPGMQMLQVPFSGTAPPPAGTAPPFGMPFSGQQVPFSGQQVQQVPFSGSALPPQSSMMPMPPVLETFPTFSQPPMPTQFPGLQPQAGPRRDQYGGFLT